MTTSGQDRSTDRQWQADGRLQDFLVHKFLRHHGYMRPTCHRRTPSTRRFYTKWCSTEGAFSRRSQTSSRSANMSNRDWGASSILFARAVDLYRFTFPSRFVLKANHGSGWNYIHHGGQWNQRRLVQLSRRWLNSNYGRLMEEWCYKDIQPRVFCEEHLGTDDGSPTDYKFFCFSGTARFIEADFDRYSSHKRNIYDRDWNLLDVQHKYPPKLGAQAAPRNLAQMIAIAERLSDGVDFVRVDLYDLGDRVVFGELTNYPAAGVGIFNPQEWDATFGSYWSLTC